MPPSRTHIDVVGVGANSVDFVYRLPHRPDFDGVSKVRIREHEVRCGGQTTTALATCASLGLRTAYVGAVGDDANGRMMLEELRRRHIDTTHAVIRRSGNPYAVILVDDASGERVVLWDRPGPLALAAADLPRALIESARLVHVDDVDVAAAIEAARIARDAGLPVTSDIDTMSDRTPELVRAVSIAIFAEHVPRELTGEADFERALRRIRSYHQGRLCVTLGARGAMMLDGDNLHVAPALAVRTVDSTGAGDVFRGAFIHALLEGRQADEILRWANVAAGLSCTKPGAMNSVPTPEEMQAA